MHASCDSMSYNRLNQHIRVVYRYIHNLEYIKIVDIASTINIYMSQKYDGLDGNGHISFT